MRRFKPDVPVDTNIVEGKKYTKTELSEIADQLLKDDSRSELCRECGNRGEETGQIVAQPQSVEGQAVYLDFNELKCPDGHVWYQGEGTMRGIGGDNPILFEEHIQSRRKREIYTTVGTPDPNIVMGIYNRVHPQGRKVNSKEQRAKHGASFYRADVFLPVIWLVVEALTRH